MIVAHHDFFCHIHFASFDSADADSADVIVVVYCGHEKLKLAVFIAFGSGDIIQNRVEKRFEVFSRHVVIARCSGLLAATI